MIASSLSNFIDIVQCASDTQIMVEGWGANVDDDLDVIPTKML